jgi:hypothetical protein
MRRWSLLGWPVLLLCVTGCGRPTPDPAACLSPGISWASLLYEAADLRTLARPVATHAASRMFSSSKDTNKVMLASLAPQITGDMDHGFFAAVQDEEDGVCATLGEFVGPGAVTWIWSANPSGTIGVFIDGQTEPALKMPFVDFLAGRFLPVREPYASVTSLGHNLHFPIVHATRCKVVLWAPRRKDLSELYYHVAWQALPVGPEIHPFDVSALNQQAPLLRNLGRRLAEGANAGTASPIAGTTNRVIACTVKPGETRELFQAAGPRAITSLQFTGRSKADLKGLWLDGFWDGKPAVHAPLHMLAGVSPAWEDTRSLPAQVAGRLVTLRWFMPFASEGRLTLSNATQRACTVRVAVCTEPIIATEYPLRFHANLRQHMGLLTDGGNILTLAEAAGPGRFVGCVLGVDSRSEVWWGEGNHLIWLDDMTRPAWQGTGTEDYFGFAWCTRGVFHHLFRGQTRVAGSREHRLAHMHRYHILDQLPFHHQGKFQFEAWGLGKGDMDWTTTILWYGAGESP